MQFVFWIATFLLGAALGSFVIVIANRYNTGLAFFKGRSFCFACNGELENKDLVPIFSFLFLRGRCRFCQAKISFESFVAEILMGALSCLAAFKSGFFTLDYFLLTAIFGLILLISIYDLNHFIIPDSFLIVLFVFSLFYILISNLSIPTASFLSSIILPLPFLLLFLISNGKWFGFGDVKYIAVLGFWLGAVTGLSGVILAFWIGALYAVVALFVFKKNLTMKSEIPFGPFLSLGAILSFYLNVDLFHLQTFFTLF